MAVKQGKLKRSRVIQYLDDVFRLSHIYLYMNFYIINRDSAGDDASQSFSMNYHTLAANEDDKDLNNSNQNDPLEHKSRGNLQNGKENVKPRNPLRRSLSAQHRAIKVGLG